MRWRLLALRYIRSYITRRARTICAARARSSAPLPLQKLEVALSRRSQRVLDSPIPCHDLSSKRRQLRTTTTHAAMRRLDCRTAKQRIRLFDQQPRTAIRHP